MQENGNALQTIVMVINLLESEIHYLSSKIKIPRNTFLRKYKLSLVLLFESLQKLFLYRYLDSFPLLMKKNSCIGPSKVCFD